jgi:wyosine [tRNA(Phe)-imidazoG37] synthetase (radical SAM superfamily)
MPTFLFDKIVFGPVKSRRLGLSLGINLLPVTQKICNFDCVYCECGLNTTDSKKNTLPSREEVFKALESRLLDILNNGQIPDVITFAGNGEPTMHPDFADIIDDTIALRNKYAKSTLISVLSNSTMLHKTTVVNALKKVDQNVMKLDSGIATTVQQLNRPTGKYNLQTIINQLKIFKGNVIIQTMFIKGNIDGTLIDNTTEDHLQAWEATIQEINPKMVMIYTIERDTPFQGLKKITKNELVVIAERLKKRGVKVQVSA